MSRDDTPPDLEKISPAERVLLAQELLASVLLVPPHSAISSEQTAELRRRMSAIDSGDTTCEPWEAVIRRLLRR